MGRGKFQDLAGQCFGRLRVIQRAENKGHDTAWLCRCNCGRECVVRAFSLKRGTTKSCGCLAREVTSEWSRRVNTKHGKHKTRLHTIWALMKDRCYNKKSKSYKNYGGRGITVCDEWRNDFIAFDEWANTNGYNDMLTIDRIDVNGNYEPSNCRWITLQEQAFNKRTSRFVEYNGKKKTVAEWAKEIGLGRKTLEYRLDAGWPLEKALSSKKYNKWCEVN